MKYTDKDLDSYHKQLTTLTANRINELARKGTDYHLYGGSKLFKLLSDPTDKDTVYLDTSANIYTGHRIQADTGSGDLIITGVETQAGRLKATVVAVQGTIDIITKDVVGTTPGKPNATTYRHRTTSTGIPVVFRDGKLCALKGYGLTVGSIIRKSGEMYVVEDTYPITGFDVLASVRPYDPTKP
ncbi:MAG: hypothetical protein CXR31_12675 [Geobacter sp.]|nr:MAG: hypothetical protein CXR31_12675 [Geobacter sp.]